MGKLTDLIWAQTKVRDQTDTTDNNLISTDEVMVYHRERREIKSMLASSFIGKAMALGVTNLRWVLGTDHKILIDGTPDNPGYGWRDIIADLAQGKVAGGNAPTWGLFRTNSGSPTSNGIYAYQFSASALNELWITFHINHDYALNTKLYPHIHFSPMGTGTGVVRWGIEYTAAIGHDQAAFPATQTVYVDYNIASNKQYRHLIAEVSDGDALDITGLEVDSLVMCRIFRDGAHDNDTYASAVSGLTCDVHYQCSTWATRNKAPDFYSSGG